MLNKLILLYIISVSTVLCFGQSNELIDSPLTKYDFTSDEWLLLYNELTIDSVNFNKHRQEKILAIEDGNILDSFKTEFVCDLNKQIDGYHVFVISLISNNEEKEYFVWDNKKNISLGKLRPYFKPTTHHYYQTSKLDRLKKKIDKWENNGWFVITNIETKKVGDYYVSAYEIKK